MFLLARAVSHYVLLACLAQCSRCLHLNARIPYMCDYHLCVFVFFRLKHSTLPRESRDHHLVGVRLLPTGVAFFFWICIYFSMAARAVLVHCYGAACLHTLCVQRHGEAEGTARCAAIRELQHNFYPRVWAKFSKLWKEEVEAVMAVVKSMDADEVDGRRGPQSQSSASSSHVNINTSAPDTRAAERDIFDSHRAIEVTFVTLSGRSLGQHWFHYGAALYDVEMWVNKHLFTELGPNEIWVLAKNNQTWNTQLVDLPLQQEEALTLTLVKKWVRKTDLLVK